MGLSSVWPTSTERTSAGRTCLRPNRPAARGDGTRCVRIEFWPTAYCYRQGHRIRVIVASGALRATPATPAQASP